MKNLLEAVNKVMAEVSHVPKTGFNSFHGYKYSTEADVLEAVRPAMVKHGLVLIPSIEGDERVDVHGNTYLSLAYTLTHISGEIWPEKIRVIGSGNDFSPKTSRIGDKGPYKASTGGNKYLILKLFQLATGDDPENSGDQELEAAQTRRRPQAQTPRPTPVATNGSATRSANDSASPPPRPASTAQLDRIKTLSSRIGLAPEDVLSRARNLSTPSIADLSEMLVPQATSLINELTALDRR